MAITQLSPQQQAVIRWVKEGKGSLNLLALAGTGKTSTLMEIAKVISGTAYLGAFNKSIADEFVERLAAQRSYHVKGGTLHSAGYSAWRKVTSRLSSPDSRKVGGIAKQRFAWDRKLMSVIGESVSYAKQSCFGVEGQPSFEDVKAWESLITYYDLQEEIPGGFTLDTVIERCIEVYRTSLEMCQTVIDFDDMLLAPLYFKAPFNRYDWVMLDEAQDCNAARRLIAFAMMKPNARMVAVGDFFQAIYAFAGANSDSLALIAEEMKKRGPFTELPLSVTYRCPKKVVDLAQTWVPDFTAHENAPEGEVTVIRHDMFWEEKFTANDAILCRNTRPLVGIAWRLRDAGIPCYVEGRNTKGIKGLITKWGDRLGLNEWLEMLDIYQMDEVQKFRAKGQEEKADRMLDRCLMLKDMSKRARRQNKNANTDDLLRMVDFLFGAGENTRNILTLCTVHRSKGREWNKVYLIGRNRYMPSQWAKKEWEQQQEKNLQYVAVTRAKKELVEVEVPFKKRKGDLEWWEDGYYDEEAQYEPYDWNEPTTKEVEVSVKEGEDLPF